MGQIFNILHKFKLCVYVQVFSTANKSQRQYHKCSFTETVSKRYFHSESITETALKIQYHFNSITRCHAIAPHSPAAGAALESFGRQGPEPQLLLLLFCHHFFLLLLLPLLLLLLQRSTPTPPSPSTTIIRGMEVSNEPLSASFSLYTRKQPQQN